MDRRRYLRAVGASLSPLLAGCSTEGRSGTGTPTATETTTPTESPTPSETDQYADSPGDVDVPRYIELLPDKHLGGTERTDNANFFRIDWEWYLEMRDQPMEFGAAADSDWTLAPTEENFANAPEYDILKGPVNAVLITGFNIENIIGEFPNAGPEMLRQCGLVQSMDAVDDPPVEEVITYAQPGVMYFVGVDTDAFRESVKENDSREYDNVNITAYTGAREYSDRDIYVSDEMKKGVVALESANEDSEALQPTLRRLGDANNSIIVNNSVRWALPRINTNPVITGEINGGKQKLAGSGYSGRGLSNLSSYDTIFQSFNTDGQLTEAELITSHLEGEAPKPELLKKTYGETDGAFSTDYHPNVSKISAKWM